MVETITPVVHGGRRSRWTWFLALHVAGATLSAAAFGALLGGVGSLLGSPWGAPGIALVLVAALAYLAREALGLRVPVPQLRRQVPDWWRTFFPFAPASFLYGVGLGVGFFTYLAHGTLVVVSVAAIASGRPLAGAVLLAPFGLARGATALVARRASTPEANASLVSRLAERATWRGWSLAHAIVLGGVAAASGLWLAERGRSGDVGGAAAAVLAIAFSAAAAAKVARPRRWRRALSAYRLPDGVTRAAAVGVPVGELAIALLPVLGLGSIAGGGAVAALVAFSAAIVLARVRSGPRLACGCFGTAAVRDYRALLGRNAVLLVVALVAWLEGADAWVGGEVAAPAARDALPAVLVIVGLALIAWLVTSAVTLVRRGARA
jgi:hypothetical protein